MYAVQGGAGAIVVAVFAATIGVTDAVSEERTGVGSSTTLALGGLAPPQQDHHHTVDISDINSTPFTTFTNPVIGVDAPDPGVQFLGGQWVMASTGGGPNGTALPIRMSSDMIHWKLVGAVFSPTTMPVWSDNSTFWAPEIHEIPKASPPRYNVYFTSKTREGVLAVGVASSASPTGPFAATQTPLVFDAIGAIDASFYSENGSHYVVWKTDGNSAGQPCRIRVQELTADGMALAPATKYTELITNDLAWEGGVVEAPWVVKRDSTYYLFYSGEGYADSQYCVGVARSKTLLGPYTKSSAPVMSQFASDPTGKTRVFAGPGHCSVVRLPGDRDTWAMVYHAWLAPHVNAAPGRVVLVDPLTFDAEGWPEVGHCNTPSSVAVSGTTWAPVRCVETTTTEYHITTSQWGTVGWTTNGTIGSTQAKFRFTPGILPGGTVSVESVEFPGHFYRHRNSFLELDKPDGTMLFGQDSSFMLRPGLLGGEAAVDPLVSLRLINYPHSYIRHENGRLQISTWDGTTQLSQDGSFHLVAV
eukprot:m.217033 g.217033  ORF g.217033 m.217033 type:complete len:530 (-) comp25667_c0_seq2:96-1685(-)